MEVWDGWLAPCGRRDPLHSRAARGGDNASRFVLTALGRVEAMNEADEARIVAFIEKHL